MSRGRRRVVDVEPEPIALVLPEHERIDLELRQRARRIGEDFFAFIATAVEAFEAKVWERYGHEDPGPYFDERIGVGYRTVRRWLTVHQAVGRLPEAEHAEARAALLDLGAHKAAVLAPVFARNGQDWRALIERARALSESAIQAQVSEETGAPRRGSRDPGERAYAALRAMVPPDYHEQMDQVFHGLFVVLESRNPILVMIRLLDLGMMELVAQGRWRE